MLRKAEHTAKLTNAGAAKFQGKVVQSARYADIVAGKSWFADLAKRQIV